MGLAVSPAGDKLFFADGPTNEVKSIAVSAACGAGSAAPSTAAPAYPASRCAPDWLVVRIYPRVLRPIGSS
eukprot:8708410-Pyramimonas_sp.AAC.2